MLSILITVFVLLVVNFGNGIIIGNILKMRTQSFVLTSLLGIIGTTLLETITAFFFPLNYLIEVIFVVIGLGGTGWFLISEKRFPMDIRPDFWFWFFLVSVIFLASFTPYLYDHYSYYVPTISYLKEVGFVKGISNFDLLLGQTSFWHIYQAGFSHFTDPFLKINSYLSVLFLIYIYERKQYFLLVFLPIFLLFVQQPSPDLPILVLTIIVINELINNRETPIILYLSLFAFCIKPIVFWLPLFVILHCFYQKITSLKLIVPVFCFGILLITKNIWLFGFPVFPVSFVDFNLPWKPSPEILTYSSQIGLMKSYDMRYSYQQISEFNFFEKIYHWFTIGYKSALNVGIIISLFIVGCVAFRKKDKFYYLLLICLLIKTILILSFSAQYRFFIDVYLIALFLLLKNVSKSKSIFAAVFISIFVSLIFIFPGFLKNKFHSGKWMPGFQWSQIIKPNEFRPEGFQSYQLGNVKFKCTKGLIYNNSFPALSLYWLKTYQYYGIFPQSSDDGFIQKKMNEEEKFQLKKIITETEKLKPQFP